MPAARLLCSLLLFAASDPASADPSSAGCPWEGDAVAVKTRDHTLWLCQQGQPVARFSVALGRGGVGKRERGDARTPLGIYPLGDPRPSRRFRTFIPIGYPTLEQTARGFSGGDVGIHGPDRRKARLPAAKDDWTLGCIATATYDDLARIASFVRLRRPSMVVIH